MELRLAAAHVIVDPDQLDADDGPSLDPGDAHHLARVLRLHHGEVITATDGVGRWRPYRWRGADHRPAPDGPITVEPAPEPAITVGFTPVKGDRPEWTVAKLTELGVDRIVPLRTERSVVRWDGDRGVQAVQRLRRIVRESVMQSRRCHVPRVSEVLAPDALPDAALAHFDGGPLSLRPPAVLIGPEGGWSEAELAAPRPHVTLGPFVLRAETAALAAAALLGTLRSGGAITLRGHFE
jgi:16S rRNA (uracil1498-N3)-methyltransferase